MKLHKTLVSIVGALALLVGVLPHEAKADETLKFGTLAPKQSVWGQVFQVWEKAVKAKSSDKLALQFDWNGVQGDEGSMAGKIKSGQLDGAALTAVGLSKFYKPVLAMQMPGLLTDWNKVDAALKSKGGEFNKGLQEAGARNLGWGFVGMAHLFVKGNASVTKPADLKSRKPYMWRDDLVAPVFYQVIGATPVPLNVPEVLPGLKAGTVDTVVSPALAVEQLQWAGQLDQVSNQITGAAIGAIVINEKRLGNLPGDLRTIVVDTGAIAAKALTDKIKTSDSDAFNRMKLKKFDVDKSAFDSTFKEVRKRLAQGTFTADLVSALESAAGVN